jgi:hypothetical protein
MSKLIFFISFILVSPPAFAYIGPGMGAGVIAGVIGFIGAIIIGLWAVLYYPIKRALRKKREQKECASKSDNQTE